MIQRLLVGACFCVLAFAPSAALADDAPIITTPSIVAPSTTTPSPPPPSASPPPAIPPKATAPPETTTAPRGTAPNAGSQPAPAMPSSLAVVTDPGEGLTIQGPDGTQSAGQAGQPLHVGDLLITGQPTSPTGTSHPATIRWLAGGMSQLYDAKPRIFVSGHSPAPPVQTTARLAASPNPRLEILGGFVRFWFPPGDPRSYSFTAFTQVVSTATAGTDFTIGHDPAGLTSTIGVTQDTVRVMPANPSLRPFALEAGSQVDVNADRVGPITSLADQAAANRGGGAAHRNGRHGTWLVGMVAALLLAAAMAVVAVVSRRRRRHRESTKATTALRLDPALLTRPLNPQPPAAVKAKPEADSPPDEPLPLVTGQAPSWRWHPTHRVPAEALPARAIPDGGAEDVALLQEGLEVVMVEERGEWANVAASSGWSGWVQADRLEPSETSTPTTQ